MDERRKDKRIIAAVLCLILSVFVSLGSYASSFFMSAAATLLVVAVMLFFVVRGHAGSDSGDTRIRVLPALLTAFTGIIGVSVVNSIYQLDSYTVWGFYVGFLLCFIAGRFLPLCLWRCVLAVMALGGVVMGVWDVVRLLGDEATLNIGVSGFFLSPNTYGTYINLCILGVVAAFFAATQTPRKVLWGALAAALFLMLLLSGSTGALLFLVIAAVPFLWLQRSTVRAQAKWCGAFVLVCGLAGALSVFLSTATDSQAKLVDGVSIQSSHAARTQIWGDGLSIALEKPLTGYGAGMFRYPYAGAREELRTAGFHVHMDSLEFWIEAGIFAPLLFYVIGLWILYLYISFMRKSDVEDDKKRTVSALFFGLLTVILHSHISMPLHNISILMALGLFLGVFYAYIRVHDYALPVKLSKRMQGVFLSLVLLTFLHAASVNYLEDQAFAKARAAQGMEQAVAALNEYNAFVLGRDADPYILAASMLAALVPDDNLDPAVRSVYLAQAEDLVTKAGSLSPFNPAVPYTRGFIVSRNPAVPLAYKLEHAAELYRKALDLDPLYLPARVDLAESYLKLGQRDEAKSLLFEAANINYQTFNPAAYFKALCLFAEKDREQDERAAIIYRTEDCAAVLHE